ncbi:MAG: hypothetical protein Q8L29_03875 [archaeon]|nr:hypothetical protein [archaeon]
MMPHKHFIISMIFVILIALFFFPPLPYIQIFLWIVLAGIFSIIVDLDSIILLYRSNDKKLKPFKDYSYLNSHFSQFMKIISDNGIMKTALRTHVILSAVYLALAYLFINPYFIPISIGILSHLLSDIPNLKHY